MARIPEICKEHSEEAIEAFKELEKYFLEPSGYAYCRCEMHPIKEKGNMEFDKSKILTVVTADQAKVGSIGYFSNYIPALKGYIENGYNKHAKLTRVMLDAIYPFFDGYNHYSLFYPAPEPTYAERQAEWVKENNVKVGTKVRVIRTFTSYEDGCDEVFLPLKGTFIGDDCTVDVIRDTCIIVRSKQKDDWWRFPYFVLEVIKEPTYKERQAEWVKENNVKVGTKVRFTKGFNTAEDGSGCCEHRDAKGVEGFVSDIEVEYLFVRIPNAGWAVPFTALEIIKEPTYRPFNNDELNDLVGEVLTNKQSGRKKLVTGKPTASEGVNLDGSYISAKDLLASFYRNTDKPCGIEEDK